MVDCHCYSNNLQKPEGGKPPARRTWAESISDDSREREENVLSLWARFRVVHEAESFGINDTWIPKST